MKLIFKFYSLHFCVFSQVSRSYTYEQDKLLNKTPISDKWIQPTSLAPFSSQSGPVLKSFYCLLFSFSLQHKKQEV